MAPLTSPPSVLILGFYSFRDNLQLKAMCQADDAADHGDAIPIRQPNFVHEVKMGTATRKRGPGALPG